MKIGELNQKVQQKLQVDQKTMEEAMQERLKGFNQSLNKSMKNTVNTIESNMQTIENQTKLLRKASVKAKIFNFCMITLLSMGLILGLVLASKTVGFYMINKINILQANIEELEQEHLLRLEIVENLQTWGIQTHEDMNGRFLILPNSMTVNTNWKVGDQEAIKLENR